MVDSICALWRDEEGATMVEYALVVTLVALICVAGFAAAGIAVPKMEEVPEAMGYR